MKKNILIIPFFTHGSWIRLQQRMGHGPWAGDSFEAEILTKKNDLVDRVHIEKATGYIRSAY